MDEKPNRYAASGIKPGPRSWAERLAERQQKAGQKMDEKPLPPPEIPEVLAVSEVPETLRQRHAALMAEAKAANISFKGRPKHGRNLAEMPRSLSGKVRARTNDLEATVEFFVNLADGKIQGCTVKDRADAHRWLADRGAGRAVDTIVNVESDANPLADVPTEDLISFVKKSAV